MLRLDLEELVYRACKVLRLWPLAMVDQYPTKFRPKPLDVFHRLVVVAMAAKAVNPFDWALKIYRFAADRNLARAILDRPARRVRRLVRQHDKPVARVAGYLLQVAYRGTS